MYVRTNKRKNKDGSVVEYIQLAHNKRHPKKGYSQVEVIYTFGRRDQLDTEAIKRLVKSLCRFVSPDDAFNLQAGDCASPLKFVSSRPAGGAMVLRYLWERVNIGECLKKALKDRSFKAPVEEALFALVVNRALAPRSKLAVEEWIKKDVFLGNQEDIQIQHLYRAMDFLLEHQDSVQKEVCRATANLLNLTADLIFFDTANTYFETDDRGLSDLKSFCKSKHKRDDLPHVTVGLAVTREGIPVRCRVMPGNQNDARSVDQIQKDLNSWKLGRAVWVTDRCMTSDENRRILRRAGGQYILGEKIRSGNLNKEALKRGGRFKVVRDNIHIKEVTVGEGTGRRRFIVVYNPEEAEHDKHTRNRILERIRSELASLDKSKSSEKREKSKYLLPAHRSMGRYLKEQKNGTLCIDKEKIRQEEKLDGKYLLSSSDDSLSAEDIALGYRQLYEAERAFRTLKSSLCLRPVYHNKDERIQSHVLLCWLALLLVRIAELETGMTWNRIRNETERLHIGEFVSKDGRVLQYTELTQIQRNIFKKLNIRPPRTVQKIDLAP
ncbi:MAG: IS1634 family transposase [Desulfobacterales bacterium]|nr:IS1634 family transposase [Desulfobacterales bacterium]